MTEPRTAAGRALLSDLTATSSMIQWVQTVEAAILAIEAEAGAAALGAAGRTALDVERLERAMLAVGEDHGDYGCCPQMYPADARDIARAYAHLVRRGE